MKRKIFCEVCGAWQELEVLKVPAHPQWVGVVYRCETCQEVRRIVADRRARALGKWLAHQEVPEELVGDERE